MINYEINYLKEYNEPLDILFWIQIIIEQF